ncbi:kinase-like protein [Artomyces pyxidatus]|uniref:Kinase-like protein n=1 Tax=Artomyces pyxidatus TaxID=48021 RepID=A0ACB8T040_9AGAM|nr:kinase-like protein [Artomyces pyxidatus]
MPILSCLRRVKLAIYFILTTPSHHQSIRTFRFGIPLLIKTEYRQFTTEADALRFLNASGLDLPIPRLVDSIAIDGNTYTVMTRLPGRLLRDEVDQLSDPEVQAIVDDIQAILHRLWTLEQCPEDAGKVMLSASGHGLPNPMTFFESYWGPCPSILDCYFDLGRHLRDPDIDDWTPDIYVAGQPDLVNAVTADRVVWVHSDLRPQNILVHHGRLSGIIDWENSGWLPLHWQVHALRGARVGYTNRVRSIWLNVVFPPETEAGFKASMKLLRYLPV